MARADILPVTARRFPDWPERLADFIESRREAPFAWGSNDCCMFAADAVVAITGRDPAAAFRGLYSDEEGAAAQAPGGIDAEWQRGMEGIGGVEVGPQMAQRGDVCLFTLGNMLTAGVCLGTVIAAPGAHRLAFVPRRLAQRAWTI